MASFDQFLDRQHDRSAELARRATARRIVPKKLAPEIKMTRKGAPQLTFDIAGNRMPFSNLQGPPTRRQELGGLFRPGSPENIEAMGASAIQNPMQAIFGKKGVFGKEAREDRKERRGERRERREGRKDRSAEKKASAVR